MLLLELLFEGFILRVLFESQEVVGLTCVLKMLGPRGLADLALEGMISALMGGLHIEGDILAYFFFYLRVDPAPQAAEVEEPH
jgi:hypothetical protein